MVNKISEFNGRDRVIEANIDGKAVMHPGGNNGFSLPLLKKTFFAIIVQNCWVFFPGILFLSSNIMIITFVFSYYNYKVLGGCNK